MKTKLREHLYVEPNNAFTWIISDIDVFLKEFRTYREDGGITQGKGYAVFFSIHPLERKKFFDELVIELIKICKNNGGNAEFAFEENDPRADQYIKKYKELL
jgi:hypothetical protein